MLGQASLRIQFIPTTHLPDDTASDGWSATGNQSLLRLPGRSHRLLNIHQLRGLNSYSMILNLMFDNFTYCKSSAPFVSVDVKFIPDSRNPCWWDAGVLRCVPYFYIAGFSKSGTTDLYARLLQHQSLAGTTKEKHWFDFNRFIDGLDKLENYTDMFQDATELIRTDLLQTGKSSRVVGDATPTVSWQSLYWRCYLGNEGRNAQPRYTNADVVYRLYPAAKIIFMLREPTSRLYSRYLTWLYQVPHPAYSSNPGPESFHLLVTSAVEQMRECLRQWTPRHCVYNGTLYSEMKLRLQEGVYSVYLQDWIRVFPPKQLLFIRFEDYVKDIDGTLEKVFQFFDIPPELINNRLPNTTFYGSNRGDNYNVGAMWASTKRILEEFYFPFVQDLSALLDDKRFLWHYANMART
ncbi:Carbohydrate sulfotransferase 15 [Bulinus truncatus]|nr:Carbohydrate sulfotransferase 15 [Bulinus truncatus]